MRDKIDKLKERPEEDRKAVAGSVAGLVVIVLLLGWGLVAFKKATRGPATETAWGPRSDVIDFKTIDGAAHSFNEVYQDTTSELQRIRETAAEAQLQQERQRELENAW